MSYFFIDRPVFAWVIAIIIMLTGILAIHRLPVEQYPNVAPPSISINATYPGASAETIENSVTQVIEQSLTGIDNMRYFSSSSDAAGNARITITFETNANPDIAQIQVQNKIQTAIKQLPQEVQQQGITVTKSNNSFLLVAGFYSEDGSISQQELGNMLTFTVKDAISRVNGVGNVTVFGEPNAMRIWLNPYSLYNYNLTIKEIYDAIQSQNVDIAAGQLGGLPANSGQQLNATITAQARLKTVEDFEKIILKVQQDGSQIRLKDVARIEIGSQNYSRIVRYKRKPASGIAVSLATGANALDTAKAVKKRITELTEYLPKNIKVIYPYDTTPFVKLSIKSVIKTLFEAIILVLIVMYLFLQNFRATLIPSISIPIVLLGTFGVLFVFGFSINVLTMFAMVLAIGLLVDDAIVVVENVERIMLEEKLTPKEATRKSMQQITGALIGIGLVLSAVFVPMAFFGGSAGAIYRQFAITIVAAMILSVLVALTIAPCLCATFLKPKSESTQEINSNLLRWFNNIFNNSRNKFIYRAKYITLNTKRSILIYIMIIGILIWLLARLPSSFLPNEDQGSMLLMVNAPSGATAERTLQSVKKVEDYLLNNENDTVEHLFTVTGFSFAGQAQNVAIGFVGLKDWSKRNNSSQSVFALTERATQEFRKIKNAMVFAFYPPPIRELGNSDGFDLQLVDQAGLGHTKFMQITNQILNMAAQNNLLQAVRFNGLNDVAQYKLDIDIEKASAMGIAILDIHRTLQTAFGSSYINDFIDRGKIRKVYMQADTDYRMLPYDINRWYIRNSTGNMVSFENFSKAHWTYGSPKLERFNGNSSVNIQGSATPGVSTGIAMNAMETIIKKLPPNISSSIGLEWIGLSYEEKLTGAKANLLYILSITVIFLCLAALYESWSLPLSVMLIIPLGIIGAVVATTLFNLHNNIYFQVGLLTTMGLSAKNAILIVEFAKNLYQKGYGLKKSTFMAAQQRFRPIIMTSMAFILGVLPLAIANGAGSASQNAIGICVIGGMLAATLVSILFVPMFFILIQKLSHRSHSLIKK